MARKNRVDDNDDDTEEDEVYHVEVITKARVNDEGDWEYLVKWAGYSSDSDSWEPSENVKQCHRLLTSFWKHVGTDDEDYAVGYEIAAQEDWIQKEKRYFKETFVKPSKRKAEKEVEKKERQERRKSKSTASRKSVSTDDDIVSISSEEHDKKKPTYKPLPTDSESESEVPLRTQSKGHSHPKPTVPPAKGTVMDANPQESLPTTSGTRSAPVIAPPKIVRTHQDQKSNPLVKPMNIPSKSVEAGSLLTTKQRIAAGIQPLSTGPKPLQAVPKKSLTSLSFKKNKPSVPVNIQMKDATVRASSASAVPPTSPAAQHTAAMDNVPVVASPEPMDVDEPVDLFPSTLDDAGALSGSLEMPPAPLPSTAQEQVNAEKFLQTVNIPELNTSLESDVLCDKIDVQLSGSTKSSLTISKIPKKWKWSGDLFISTSDSRTEPLCPVTIADPSGTSNSSYINLLLSSVDSLRVSRLYPIMDLSPVIRSCGKPQYFGRLDASMPDEEALVQGLNHHLTVEALAAAIPLSLDSSEVALLLLIPGSQKGLAKVLQVPEQLVDSASLLVVLLSFSVSDTAAVKAAGWRSLQAGLHPLAGGLHIPEISQKATLTQAMVLLGFPRALLDFLNSSFKTYHLWPSLDELSSGLDDILLQLILRSTKATLAKVEEDARVIFISNGHLETLYTLPSFVSKRVDSPEIQFWTYGYYTNVSSVCWRLKEVFPLGGIITFTAAAITEDPVGCYHLMCQAAEHPLWACYLIPEVLAAIHLSYGDDSSISSETLLDPILGLIDLGMISLMKVPEKNHSDREDWISQAFDQSCHTGHELLAFYVSALKNHSAISSMTTQELFACATIGVTNDLRKAQIHPTFMESYRRFVVIKSSIEDIASSDREGLEWCSLSSFHFKDDYFQA